jgi:hypothetical protein
VRVLIVGSLHHDPAESVKDAFVDACKEIGAALARAGFEFVVGSSSPNTADRWVLEGAASIEGKHRVFVFRPDDGPTPKFPADEAAKGTFIMSYRRLRGPWAGGRVSQIQAADCVLMIGGARGTAQVGYSAMALEKPVLAVACFGGSAADTWTQFEPFYERLSVTREQVGNLREEWQAGNDEIVIKVLTELVRRKIFSRTRLAADALPLLLNMGLFATWVWLFVAPPQPWQASFFALLAVSAFLGTALRGSLRSVVDLAERPSRNGLIAELSAGLVLAFALALLYLAGSFTFTGGFKVISPSSSLDDYQRVAVAMGLFGVAGGWLIERVAQNLTNWFSSRLPGADES